MEGLTSMGYCVRKYNGHFAEALTCWLNPTYEVREGTICGFRDE